MTLCPVMPNFLYIFSGIPLILNVVRTCSFSNFRLGFQISKGKQLLVGVINSCPYIYKAKYQYDNTFDFVSASYNYGKRGIAKYVGV